MPPRKIASKDAAAKSLAVLKEEAKKDANANSNMTEKRDLNYFFNRVLVSIGVRQENLPLVGVTQAEITLALLQPPPNRTGEKIMVLTLFWSVFAW